MRVERIASRSRLAGLLCDWVDPVLFRTFAECLLQRNPKAQSTLHEHDENSPVPW